MRRIVTRLAAHTSAKQFQPRFAMRSFVRGGVVGAGIVTTVAWGATTLCWGGKSDEAPPFDAKALRKDIEDLVDKKSCGPVLIRLAWHEAGTWDAKKKDGHPNDASMRFAPECKHAANAGLQSARDLLEPLKKKYPTISYADLWSYAACVAISQMGGPEIPWRWGRSDAQSAEECAPDGRLPDAAQTQDHVRAVFYRMGFNDREIVALIGAHTVGECHADRSGYVGPWTHDKLGFDNAFYSELLENDWIVDKRYTQLQFTDSKTRKLMMLPGDIAFLVDPAFKKVVEVFAKDQDAFHRDFAKAFQKLVELGVEKNLKRLPA